MKKDILRMSQRERQRYHLLKMVLDERITLRQASERMGVCYRHSKRLKRSFRLHGAKGLVHGNRDRASPRGLDQALKDRIIELSEDPYGNFNDTHFTEKLNEIEGICVSRETVRKHRRACGIKPKRRRRPKKHHKRRLRKAQEGMMVLWDGSPHRWFGNDTAPCCLMAAVDDANGKLLEAFFIEYECSFGYLRLLKEIVTRYGIPASIYQDRHSALHRNDDNWSLEEQLAGEQEPTQVGCALKALGITPIFALSPQAKGRIERPFGVLQDRLMAEMQLLGIKEIPEANTFLKEIFIEDYNSRFAVKPEQSQAAWCKVPRGLDIERIISFGYQTTVGNDSAVRLGGLVIDIPEGPNQRGYAKAKVEVRQLLDGSWRVYYKDKLIAKTEPTPLKEPIRARPIKRPKAKAATKETWIYLASAPQLDITEGTFSCCT
jgi:transposase